MPGKIEAQRSSVAPTASVADDVVITAREAQIGDGVRIESGVRINAKRLVLGPGAVIGAGTTIGAVGGAAEHFEVGDAFFLGPSSTVLVPVFLAGDYVAVHNHLLCNGYKPCVVGHNTWVGQNCVLNATDRLTIGNNVGIGAYSSVYTHAFNGELLEGCEVHRTAPVEIRDNAWLVGGYNVVSPGVVIGSRTMVLTSSVVTADVPDGHCVGGVPARDMTARVQPFRHVSIAEKLSMMSGFVEEYATERHAGAFERVDDGFLVSPRDAEAFAVLVVDRFDPAGLPSPNAVVYAAEQVAGDVPAGVTVFDVTTKEYTKRRTSWERDLIGFMNGFRARFVPVDRPRVTWHDG